MAGRRTCVVLRARRNDVHLRRVGRGDRWQRARANLPPPGRITHRRPLRPVTRRIPQLDAVRGIAILLVMLHNQRETFPSLHLDRLFANGWMGVDLFFVLSGFLITGILVDTKRSEGYFRNFYARRCLRIWPLYYSVLVFMFVIVPLLRPSDAHTVFDRSSPWWSYPLFIQNFLIPIPTNAAGPLAVTWSLA